MCVFGMKFTMTWFFMLSYRKNISNRQTSSQKMISIKIEKHIYTIEIENKK